jgi:3-methylcrotonyl-CoA carboxylase alpha subunit
MIMFHKLLIANRGEIACRIIRTARNMGIPTVAVYSEADAHGLHVQQADEAFYLGTAPAADSYLNIEALINIAKRCKADAIHPGYGFLSENPELARACHAADITFIGPSVEALEIMGSKRLAKQALANTNVPLIPGYHGEDQSDARLFAEANTMGYPVLIKAANGGGGKGMREVTDAKQFMEALAGARREALSSFGDDTMLLEKLIQHPRHIEVQIMADNFGKVVHLFERDCSIQRRHQKVIEEAPANHLSANLRQALADAAVTVAKTIDYRGAGTVECLVDNQNQFYFMEMNTRLQVEHPVTEMITGLDLVAWQIQIAANQPLPRSQDAIQTQGHAIECRLYAEDPHHDFLPSIGDVRFLRYPNMEHVRIDTAITEHSQISIYYDPMIAKIIAWGSTRPQAIQRLTAALQHCHIGGIKTNLPFLLTILQQPAFMANTFDTQFLSTHPYTPPATDHLLTIKMAAAIHYAQISRCVDPLYQATFAWQMHLSSQWFWHYRCQDQLFTILIKPHAPNCLQLQVMVPEDKHPVSLTISCTDNILTYNDGEQSYQRYFEQLERTFVVYTDQGPVEVEPLDRTSAEAETQNQAQLTAPMPGTVIAILKQLGDSVTTGDAIIVLEAMKMEHTIRAPHAGTIQDIFYAVGAQVQEGATLAALESS